MKLSSLAVLFAASGDAKPTPEARAAMKAKKNTQDLAWELLFNSGKLSFEPESAGQIAGLTAPNCPENTRRR